MNKLISKNPILRFKLGLKIVKAAGGSSFAQNAGQDKIHKNKKGNYYFTRNGYNYFSNGDVYNVATGKLMPELHENYTRPTVFDDSNMVAQKTIRVVPKEKALVGKNAPTKSSTNKSSTRTTFSNRAVNGYTLPEGVNNVAEILDLLVKEGYLLPKYGVDGLWGAETQAAWEAKKSFDELQNMKENFGNKPSTQTTISPELQQAFTKTTPDYIGESTNKPLAFQLPQNVNRKYVRSMIRTFGRNPYGDYTPQERAQMRTEINNGTFDTDKWFGESGLNNTLPIQSNQQAMPSSTNTPPSNLYNISRFSQLLTNWINRNPGIYNNLASIFAIHQPSVATPTYVPNYNTNYNENNPLTYRYTTSIYKKGGLISKNPVEQFKNRDLTKYQLGGWLKHMITGKPSKGVSLGGGRSGGGGATTSWDTETENAKDDEKKRYTVVLSKKLKSKKDLNKENNSKPKATSKSKVASSNKPNLIDLTLSEVVVTAQRPEITANFATQPNMEISPIAVPQIPRHYNRRQTREYIRTKGLNPYHMGSLQRKLLRKYLNGELTSELVSPTTRYMAEEVIHPNNDVYNNYNSNGTWTSNTVADVKEFFRPAQ